MSRATDFPDEEEQPSRGESEPEEEGGRPALKIPKLSFGKRISDFYQAVKLEMRKTSWPARNDVWSTTVVVIIAVIFFGFYLWGVDVLITLGFESLKKLVE